MSIYIRKLLNRLQTYLVTEYGALVEFTRLFGVPCTRAMGYPCDCALTENRFDGK